MAPVSVLVPVSVFLPQLVLASTRALASPPELGLVWRKHMTESNIGQQVLPETHFFRSGFGGTTAVTFFFALKPFFLGVSSNFFSPHNWRSLFLFLLLFFFLGEDKMLEYLLIFVGSVYLGYILISLLPLAPLEAVCKQHCRQRSHTS